MTIRLRPELRMHPYKAQQPFFASLVGARLGARLQAQRLFAFQRAAELKNVSAACRELGRSRALFYRWKRRVDRYGADGLRPRRTQARRGRPPQVPAHVERTLIGLALA